MSLRHRYLGGAVLGLASLGMAAALAGAAGAAGGADDVVKPEWREGDDRAEVDALEGKAPPELKLKDWTNGDAVALADLKGKVVLIDFWATWCGPCINAIPHTNELQAKHKDKGLVVIAVCNSRGAETMAEVVKDKAIEYLTAADVDGKTVDAYHVGSFPDYYLVDRAGNLRIADCANGSVDEAVEALLAEPAPPGAAAAAR
jgi:cytochrome c biogenesis protein CcmG/thiol:disulfide interchange protein DsbE